jgi:Ser/Thr protein kinase RdoA (MazF antagonist)
VKPYSELTHHGKMRRMRLLADAALEAYGLADAPRSLFIDNGNIIYRVKDVRTPRLGPDDGASELFFDDDCALRIHQPGYHESAAFIASEVAWLAALRREVGVPVPEPVPTPEGELMTQVEVPGVEGPRICSLLRWVKGRMVTKGVGPQHLKAQGRLMAQLHNHAARWGPPQGFTRLAYDWEGLFGEGTGTGLPASTIWEDVPERFYGPFALVAHELQEVMDAWGNGPYVYGLIHADLGVDANVLFWHGDARAIDFDDCRFGYWMFDLAVALEHVQEDTVYPQFRDALLEGYTETRALPEEQARRLPLFLAAVNALLVVWPVAMMHRFGYSAYWMERMNRAGQLIERYVDGRGAGFE